MGTVSTPSAAYAARMDEAAELYALRPEDFVAARNALAKRLRAEGRKDEAAAVAKHRRPSVAAWALNQVARSHPDLVTAALAAGDALRSASDDVGSGAPGELRAATLADRTAANAVVKAAGEVLGPRAAAQQTALLGTLRAAALDEAVAEELRRGVLSADHEQAGFGFGFDSGESPPAPRTKPRGTRKKPTLRAVPALEPTEPTEPDDAEERERQARARAEQRARDKARRKERAELQRVADRRTKEAARLGREADEAEAEAVAARTAADAAQQKATDAQEALEALDAAAG